MKKTIVASVLGIAASVALVSSSYGQGSIIFNNYQTAAGQVTYGAGTDGTAGAGVDATYQAALYFSLGSSTEPADPTGVGIPITLTLVTGSTPFQITPSGGGYFLGPTLTIPGYNGGPVTFEIVAWKGGATYGDPLNVFRGHSAAFTMAGGIATGQSPAPNFDSGLTDFAVHPSVVPEPSTFALIGLGTGALLFFRRRK